MPEKYVHLSKQKTKNTYLEIEIKKAHPEIWVRKWVQVVQQT